MGAWKLWKWLIIGTPPRITCVVPRDFFSSNFDAFFGLVLRRVFSIFRTHLGAQVALKIAKNPSREPTKTIQNRNVVSDPFLYGFFKIFGAYFGPLNP